MPQSTLRRALTRRGAALLASTLAGTLTTAALVAAPASAGGNGYDGHDGGLAPRTSFTMAPDGSSGATEGGEGIPNIDSVKSTIRTYYNAAKPGSVGIADKTSSPYISEMKRIAGSQWDYLAHAKLVARAHHRRPAIVLDADDTTLWTYDMEDKAMNFVFDPALQNTFVQDQRFPATPAMVDFVNTAHRRGFAIFGLTGRNDDQKTATLANLAKVGYTPFTKQNFFTKWTGKGPSRQPSYISCATAKCSTVEYKAGTRRWIEHKGYEIVLNVGDQWSDLMGGHSDRNLKLPNPTYYLPSTNLPGVSEPGLAPRTRFTMAPDGSSGATESGEGIPNIDSVKSTIRTYYRATGGVSDKSASPYIDELAGLTDRLGRELTGACTDAAAAGEHPAVVLDADDTTLWTYDMEDKAMNFVFDPAVQNNDWVQPQRFPATPTMVGLTNALNDAGCTLVGLTGRKTSQKDATLGNLAKLGYRGFTSELYFTKWESGGTPPAYVDCGADHVCSTAEYKSQTRKHVVEDLGYDVLANLGDQFSDLLGGYADQQVKLPNPTYYLP